MLIYILQLSCHFIIFEKIINLHSLVHFKHHAPLVIFINCVFLIFILK